MRALAKCSLSPEPTLHLFVPDDGSLELGENPENFEQGLTGGDCGVHPLLI